MGVIEIRDKPLELKKHINAIHCTNNLTLVQRKLFNALLYTAYPELPYKSQFKISAKKLCELIGYNSNDYAKLKKALLGLITTAIEWNLINSETGKEKNWKASSILSSAELSDGMCSYEYSQVMKDLLYQPEIYGRINIALVAEFNSTYGLALYENCIRYQGLPQTPWFTLEVFRKLMGVLGHKYPVFKDFKKRVLNMAVEDVNRISPITVEPEIERENQKVTRIRFKLSKAQHQVTELIQATNQNRSLVETLVTVFHFSEKSAAQFLMQYEHDYIQSKIDMILRSSSFKTGAIRGLSGYLVDALKNDYKQGKSSRQVIFEQEKSQAEKNTKFVATENDELNRYKDYINAKFSGYLSTLSQLDYAQLILAFEQTIAAANAAIRQSYKKYGLDSPLVQSIFRQYLLENYRGAIGDVMSREQFQRVNEAIEKQR